MIPRLRRRAIPAGRSESLASGLAALALLGASLPAAAQGHGFGGLRPVHARGGGHGGGHAGGVGRARVAIYEVLTVSGVTDAAALKASLAKLGPSLGGSGGRLVVDADDPTAVAGQAAAHVAILVFDTAQSATTWQTSPVVKAITAEIGKEGTLQVLTAGGIADPGTPPSVPLSALGPAPGRNRLPVVPNIADICKGC